MLGENYEACKYTDRNLVLRLLTRLMEEELLKEERNIIYLHCGIGVESPMGFSEITSYLRFDSLESTKLYYNKAIQKTRSAIPGSELEALIAGYRPLLQI